MNEERTDRSGRPIIERVLSKIATLERMAEHWERKLTEGRGNRDFLSAELAALRYGAIALKHHRAEVEGEDTPRLALAELVDVLDLVRELLATRSGYELPGELRGRLGAAFERAKRVLADSE